MLATGGSLVDEVLEVLGVFVCARWVGFEGEAEEDEIIGGGDDAGLRGANLLYADPGKVDAEVGDGRRVGEAEADLEFVPRAGPALHGGGVVAVGEVGYAVEEDPGGVAGGVGAGWIDDGGLEGGGRERSLHGCWVQEGSGN